MSRPPLSYMTAYLQFTIAVGFLLGYFGMMGILFLGWAQIPDNLLELAKTLAIALTNAMGLLFAFLYLRSRQDGPPDPSTTTTVQRTETTTLPTTPSETSHANRTLPGPPEPPATPAAGVP